MKISEYQSFDNALFRQKWFPFTQMKKTGLLPVFRPRNTFGSRHQISILLFARNQKSQVSPRLVLAVNMKCRSFNLRLYIFPCITNLDVCSGSLDGKIKRNNLLTTVTTFGPFFRISFDLEINSFLRGLDGLSNILSMIPAQQSPLVQINVNNVGRLDFGLGKNFQTQMIQS